MFLKEKYGDYYSHFSPNGYVNLVQIAENQQPQSSGILYDAERQRDTGIKTIRAHHRSIIHINHTNIHNIVHI